MPCFVVMLVAGTARNACSHFFRMLIESVQIAVSHSLIKNASLTSRWSKF